MLMLMLIVIGWATVVVSGAGGVSAHRFMGNGRKVIGKEIRLVGGKAENSEGHFRRRTRTRIPTRTTGHGGCGGWDHSDMGGNPYCLCLSCLCRWQSRPQFVARGTIAIAIVQIRPLMLIVVHDSVRWVFVVGAFVAQQNERRDRNCHPMVGNSNSSEGGRRTHARPISMGQCVWGLSRRPPRGLRPAGR